MLLFKCITSFFSSYSETYRLFIFCFLIIQDFGTRFTVFLSLNPAPFLMTTIHPTRGLQLFGYLIANVFLHTT